LKKIYKMSRNYNSEAKDKTNIYNYNFDDKMNIFKIKNLLEHIDPSKINTLWNHQLLALIK